MKRGAVKQAVCAILGAIVVIGGILFAFNWSKDKEHRDLARRIAEFGPRKGVPRTIDDLQRAISAYEDMQKLHVKDAVQTGVYWKILATRFQDREMFVEALKSLEHAIEYTPDDEVLHYLTGLNAARAAKSMYDYNGEKPYGERSERYLNLAETAYLRAIELQDSYTQARYALAVLYIFELDRPEAAIEQLLRYMENRSGDVDAMYLLARAMFMTGRYQEAADWYDKAIPLTKDEQKKREAMANRSFILDNL
ncbi:MAG: tetratricopeptide repeat protein [Spirochaetaceae bacterium]|jgi:tetratricopeptide (TPR) repeat protein|nr:tetratricopeptide repeat protein [Spirochaetaceae bacterium]